MSYEAGSTKLNLVEIVFFFYRMENSFPNLSN